MATLIFIVINLLLTGSLATLGAYAFWKVYPLLRLASEFGEVGEVSRQEFGTQGGVASAAKRGEKALLGQIIRRVLTDATGGFADIALAIIPDLEEWVERNPYAVLRLFQNPQVQGVIGQITAQLQQQQHQGDNYGTTPW